MKRLLAVVVIAVGTTVSGPVLLAQDDSTPRGIDPRFRRLDADGNGELARDELFMLASARFDQLDVDDDGVVSPEEFRKLELLSDQARFRNLDEDGDGRIHRDELPEGLRARFEQFDTNGDEFVDEDEVHRMALSMREARNGPTGQLRLMRRLMELDLDQDGRLHRDELPAAMESLLRRFDELDVNDDDYIDGTELRAMTEESRPMRPHKRR